MILVLDDAKKFRWFVAAGGIKGVEVVAHHSFRCGFVFLTNKSKLRQKFCVKLRGRFDVFDSKIDVIKQSCFHHFDFRLSRRIINFNPDPVSSTAQTLMSTKSSGSATARMTSSVTSVTTPDDFFGHETQIAASSAILRRKMDNCFANSPRRVANRWTNLVFPTGRVAKFTPLGIWPSNLR